MTMEVSPFYVMTKNFYCSVKKRSIHSKQASVGKINAWIDIDFSEEIVCEVLSYDKYD
jgi:hypothetical protein